MGNRWSENNRLTNGPKFAEPKEGGGLGWVPSVGQSIDFFVGKTEGENKDGGITAYIQTSKTYKIPLNLPGICEILYEGNKEIDQHAIIESAIESLLSQTDFLYELEKLCADDSDLIGANCGQRWGDEPVRYLSHALKDKGYFVAEHPTYPKIGGRNRYQTHGVLIFKKKKHTKFNHESNSTTPYFWSKFYFAPADR